MFGFFKPVALAAGIVVVGVVGAVAATVTNVSNAPGSWAMVDPTNTLDVGTGSWGLTSPIIVAGSLSGQYRSPFENATPAQVGGLDWKDIQYWNVLGGSASTLSFTKNQDSLSFLWGSVDSYNAMEFYLDGSLVSTVTNSDFLGEVIGVGASYISITDLIFDEVQFLSKSNSFEFSNITVSAIPLPAGGLLLLFGLGGLVAAGRRRKSV